MELSFGEIVVLAILAFVVLGPDELVRQSQKLGRFIAKMKTEANNFRIMAEEEILRGDLRDKLAESRKAITDIKDDLDARILDIGHRDTEAHEVIGAIPPDPVPPGSAKATDPKGPKDGGSQGG